jgi:hypothetical protein
VTVASMLDAAAMDCDTEVKQGGRLRHTTRSASHRPIPIAPASRRISRRPFDADLDLL